MTRPTIADPELVNKALDGREADVRPCIACNHCVASMTASVRRLSCTVNVIAGRETTLPPLQPCDARRRVLVIGGGPAGLEAAMVAAQRGHDVVLCDEAECLGGGIAIAAAAPHRADLGAIVAWQGQRLRSLGVDVRLGCRVDGAVLASIAPDAVVVATGGRSRLDGMQVARPALRPVGIDQSHVRSPSDVIRADDVRPATAVVLDDLGTYEAVGVTETLARRGSRVVVVTRFAEIAAELGPNLERAPAQRRLAALDIEVVSDSILTEVRPHEVVVASITNGTTRVIDAELVVLVCSPQPRDELLRDLSAWTGAVLVIGDAASPRDLTAAIREGHLAGRAV